MKRVVVLLADGFEEVEAITQIDYLRRAGMDVTVAGVTGRDVIGGHQIRVNTDVTVDELSGDWDAVVLPGGTEGAENIAADDASVALIRRVGDAGALVAAICAAPAVVLGTHSLIGDRKFTCYPGFETRVEQGSFCEDRVVVDGNLVTSRGPGTAAEFAFAIIEYLSGAADAEKLRDQTLTPV
jgi:4-methyl-5(b-hydroxyethyl)-thiazole monophosphate biosynthesis